MSVIRNKGLLGLLYYLISLVPMFCPAFELALADRFLVLVAACGAQRFGGSGAAHRLFVRKRLQNRRVRLAVAVGYHRQGRPDFLIDGLILGERQRINHFDVQFSARPRGHLGQDFTHARRIVTQRRCLGIGAFRRSLVREEQSEMDGLFDRRKYIFGTLR